jgi:hypothetical protein
MKPQRSPPPTCSPAWRSWSDPIRCAASRSFVETKKGFELIHGSEILSGRVHGYEKSKQWGLGDHCINNIITAVEQVSLISGTTPREQFASAIFHVHKQL